ncbi:MAG: 1-phosphofructokinase family hexose kinase, partial [Eubacteriales bacterium]
MIYTVTFNPALDYVMSVPSFNLNEVNRSQKEQLLFGGKGINVSVVLHRLGISSTALGFAAGFTGDVLLDGVRAAGVKTDFIRLPQGLTRINVKIQSEHETDFNGKGPEIPPESVDALFDKLDALGADDTLVLAGSIPPSLPDNIYEQILSRLSGKGVQCIVDATKDLLLNVLKYRPFLIKPNHHELGELFGTEL